MKFRQSALVINKKIENTEVFKIWILKEKRSWRWTEELALNGGKNFFPAEKIKYYPVYYSYEKSTLFRLFEQYFTHIPSIIFQITSTPVIYVRVYIYIRRITAQIDTNEDFQLFNSLLLNIFIWIYLALAQVIDYMLLNYGHILASKNSASTYLATW